MINHQCIASMCLHTNASGCYVNAVTRGFSGFIRVIYQILVLGRIVTGSRTFRRWRLSWPTRNELLIDSFPLEIYSLALSTFGKYKVASVDYAWISAPTGKGENWSIKRAEHQSEQNVHVFCSIDSLDNLLKKMFS